jgi:thiamine monophosphate synthase
VRLLAITPPASLAPVIDASLVDVWLAAGAGALGLCVLLREPGASAEAILSDARLWPLRRRLAERGVPALLSVDGRTPERDLQLIRRADPAIAGVQLRGDPSEPTCASWRAQLGTGAMIGRSIHGTRPETDPEPATIDYSCLAPIFPPNTVQPGDAKSAIGLAGLRSWTARRSDIIALGGVGPANARACLEAGAHGLAGIRLFFGRSDEAGQDVEALCRAFGAASDDHVPA